MIILLIILLILSLGLNVFAGIGIFRSLKKVETYDAFLEEMQNRIRKTIEAMRSIDIRGSFESDDEVGSIFKQMQSMVEALDVFFLEETETDASEV